MSLKQSVRRRLNRASGLTRSTHESGDHRTDGEITREGSVPLRRALMELASGLRRHDAPTRAYAEQLDERCKHAKIIWCALGRGANKIAYAMVRDQQPYDPALWRWDPHFTSAARCDRMKPGGRTRRRGRHGGPQRGLRRAASWRPALRPFAESERGQLTPPPAGGGRIHHRGSAAPPPAASTPLHPAAGELAGDIHDFGKDAMSRVTDGISSLFGG